MRLVDPGNTVFSGGSNPIVVITQLQPISVVFNVAEDYLDQVRSQVTRREALPVEAYDRARLTQIASGKLLTLDNQVEHQPGPFVSARSSTMPTLLSFPMGLSMHVCWFAPCEIRFWSRPQPYSTTVYRRLSMSYVMGQSIYSPSPKSGPKGTMRR